MSENKTYVRKPVRRYERDFDRQTEEPAEEKQAEEHVKADPDITAPVSTKYAGPPQMSADDSKAGKKSAASGRTKHDNTSDSEKRDKKSGHSSRKKSE